MVNFATYNITTPGNFSDMIVIADSFTNNLLSPMLLVLVFGVTFITLYGKGNENAFMAASIMTTISSLFMLVFASISPVVVLICIVISAISIFALPKER